jgi:uncharacterized RDD family membrane protein YckC
MVGLSTVGFYLSSNIEWLAPMINPALIVLAFLVPLLYFILFEALMNGATPGKKSAGLRVRMVDGTPVTWNAALIRNLLRPADLLPGCYLLGMACMFTNPRGQRLGDMVAGTIVIAERKQPPQYALAPHRAGIHGLEHAVGQLDGMTMEEYHALKRLADRYPELPSRIQQQFVDEIWVPFAKRRAVPMNPTVHPVYLIEAVVMKFGRANRLL